MSVSLPSTLEISTTTLLEGQVGASYSQSLSASGGTPPYHWSITAGALPAGLSLSPAGVLSGTPTVSGSPSITFGVSDSGSPAQTTSTALILTIVPAATALAVTTTSLPNGDVSVAYPSTNLEAAGGTRPYSWSGTGLATGLSVSTLGLVSGTPTAGGTFDERFTVTDSSSPKLSAVADFSVKISQTVASGQPKIVTDALPRGQVGVAYQDVKLGASGGTSPYSWSATGLAPGLTLSSGVVSGTPTQAGTFAEKFTVTDSSSPAKTATATFSVTIASSRNRRRWRSSN
jgi:Putative Ig domain